ncbi:hypothetical protein AJ80_02261 [Polytolypa hystricis UAMH7299]|uniref:Protein-S-isoprenylcysteine O-methyltransferase n=1 Tax=Polytolypa hystricis (strain UAMH7299) TaxID=1447883 RepID=A0A2B7YQR0_POLH7|nr:hypothetical protein AJ80_02261 [Polytolypa hystricis UAMH7299]
MDNFDSTSSSTDYSTPPAQMTSTSHSYDWSPPQPSYIPYNPETNSKPKTKAIDPSNLPGGKKSLSGISLRSFLLGQAFSASIILTFLAYWSSSALWRAPFFLASLALFHFLEYYITAAYNPQYATISAFLLSANGAAYNIAHGSAIAECVLGRLFLPEGYFRWTAAVFGGAKGQIIIGLLLTAVGQVVRSVAMIYAGPSFTHKVQVERRDEHVLVKDGVYSVLRHPSYFGFFWWGIGTQLVLGNPFCFLAYVVVLWQFFSSRIQNEERHLIQFFGQDYIDYRKRTWVGIPGISGSSY